VLSAAETGNIGIDEAEFGFVSSIVALVTGAGALLTPGVAEATVVDKVVVVVVVVVVAVGVTLGTTVMGAVAVFLPRR
jgi:cyanate permease